METLTDQPLVADASRRKPITQDLNRSAHPERRSASREGECVSVRVGVEGDELREACEGVFGDMPLFMSEPPFYFESSDTLSVPKDCAAEAKHGAAERFYTQSLRVMA